MEYTVNCKVVINTGWSQLDGTVGKLVASDGKLGQVRIGTYNHPIHYLLEELLPMAPVVAEVPAA